VGVGNKGYKFLIYKLKEYRLRDLEQRWEATILEDAKGTRYENVSMCLVMWSSDSFLNLIVSIWVPYNGSFLNSSLSLSEKDSC
jgi:hypothetical protein